jgi:hypothetical protein
LNNPVRFTDPSGKFISSPGFYIDPPLLPPPLPEEMVYYLDTCELTNLQRTLHNLEQSLALIVAGAGITEVGIGLAILLTPLNWTFGAPALIVVGYGALEGVNSDQLETQIGHFKDDSVTGCVKITVRPRPSGSIPLRGDITFDAGDGNPMIFKASPLTFWVIQTELSTPGLVNEIMNNFGLATKLKNCPEDSKKCP